jgi:hypothetical protein
VYDRQTINQARGYLKKGRTVYWIAKELGVTQYLVKCLKEGKGLPKKYAKDLQQTKPLKSFGTKRTICPEHNCYMPCAACAAERYNLEHGISPNADPPPSLYDEAHRRAVDEQYHWCCEIEDLTHEGLI